MITSAKPNPYATHYPTLGPTLWQLATQWSRCEPATQAARNAAIKAIADRPAINGSRLINVAREAVEDAAADIRRARSARIGRRVLPTYLRTSYIRSRCVRQQPPAARAILPEGTLEERLLRRTRAALRRVSPMRRGAAGGSSYTVTLTNDPAAVGYTVTMGANRDTYRGRYKGWAAREDHHNIIVPRSWLRTVYRRGLANLDGMLTLDAAPLDGAPDGVRLYAAVWAEQGRGYDVHTRHGYIAIADDGTAYHADTPQTALRGLGRKISRRRLDDEWDALMREDMARFAAAIAPYRSLPVRVSDARAIGACEYGIRSWCHAVGLDYEAGSAPLGDVLAAYERRPAPEARAAILHALRRARRLPKLAAA